MESRTLVCDRCAQGQKFVIAVDTAVIQTRAHGMFQLDLCEEHQKTLLQDLNALNVDHVVRAIMEHAIQARPGIARLALQRISGSTRKLFEDTLRALLEEKKIQIGGTSKYQTVTWIAAPAASNGSPILPRGSKAQADRHRLVAWMRDYLRTHREVRSKDMMIAVDGAGFNRGGLSWARSALKRQRLLRIKGKKSAAIYIWTGKSDH